MTASLYDFRDLDLMLKLAAEPDGGTSAKELSEAIGLGEEGTRAVGIRLAWMKRLWLPRLRPEDEALEPFVERRADHRVAPARSSAQGNYGCPRRGDGRGHGPRHIPLPAR